MYYKTHQNYYSAQSDPPQQNATFLLFYLLFFASNLPIKPLEQVKIAWLMLEIDCPAHQHEQKICSLAS
ncbi:hypothetical protein BSPLISOX_1370, partial [uncultured Gammaproteobacteria bacterium]